MWFVFVTLPKYQYKVSLSIAFQTRGRRGTIPSKPCEGFKSIEVIRCCCGQSGEQLHLHGRWQAPCCASEILILKYSQGMHSSSGVMVSVYNVLSNETIFPYLTCINKSTAAFLSAVFQAEPNFTFQLQIIGFWQCER